MVERIRSFDSFDSLISKLDELNLAWGLVREFGDDSFAEPSVGPRGIFVDVTDDIGEPRRTVQSPYRFSESQSGIDGDAHVPKRGEHNAQALTDWLDMDAAEIEALVSEGILQSE